MLDYVIYTFTYFVIYSFLGWCCEVGFAAAVEGKFVNRGFLGGPICPIYGIGAITVISLLERLSNNIFLLFLGAMILTSLLEWITGFVLEKFFHEKWWDYSEEAFNISGYICLKFSILWGLACCVVVKAVHPLIVKLVSALPDTILYIILAVIAAAFVADISATVSVLAKLRRSFRVIAETEQRLKVLSDRIGQNLADKVIDGKQRVENYDAEDLRARCKKAVEMAEKYGRIRLMRAFPNLKKKTRPAEKLREYIEKYKEKVAKDEDTADRGNKKIGDRS